MSLQIRSNGKSTVERALGAGVTKLAKNYKRGKYETRNLRFMHMYNASSRADCWRNGMTSQYLSGVLIVTLSFCLCMPTEAQASSGKIVGNGTIVGGIVGAVAAVAVIVIVAIHYSKKRMITGCVKSTGNGL